ncbi:MAG: hypothetical protein ACKVOP_01670 [Sphingomonadaceae bacterium]
MSDPVEPIGTHGEEGPHLVPLPHRSDGVATALRAVFTDSGGLPADLAAMLLKLDAEQAGINARR